MSDYERWSGIPAYVAGLSEFVRAFYEQRIESIEDQCDEIRHRVSVLEDALGTVKERRLSNAQRFYVSALVEVSAALEQAAPYVKTAAIIYERANEVAQELTNRTWHPDKDENETIKTTEENKDPNVEAGHPPSH